MSQGAEHLQRQARACPSGDRSWTSLRDRAAVLVLYDTGVRASELVGMRVDDVNIDEQCIKVTGKGSKERLVPSATAPRSHSTSTTGSGRRRWIHAFRRAFAIAFLDADGYAEDLQQIAGWNSLQMVQRYTKATASARARRAHRKLSPADRLGPKPPVHRQPDP